MKKVIVVSMCLVFLLFTGLVVAEVVNHSGKRGVAGKLGDANHTWAELWVNEAHFPKRIAVNLASVFCDGGNDADDASTPTLTETDNVAALVYDDSSENTGFQFAWAPSIGYVSGMQIEVVISSDTADGTNQYIDWAIFVQDNDLAFGSETAQDGVAGTSATLDASNEVVTLTLNSAGEALITAGSSVVTIELWSSPTATTGTTEIKHITILEP